MLRKLTLLSIATALVMLVSLAAAPSAWATDLDFEMFIGWVGVDPYDVQVEVQLRNSSNQPVTDWIPLQSNPGFTFYSLTSRMFPLPL